MRTLDNQHDFIQRWDGQPPSVITGGSGFSLLMQTPQK